MSGLIFQRVSSRLVADLESAVDQLVETPEFLSMGSDIERALAAAFVMGFRLLGLPSPLLKYPAGDERDAVAFIAPQFKVGRYRLDFLVGVVARPSLADCIAVECDGHDWHEKTREQAAHDKKRDRFISANVGKIIRFTGSEIYRDPVACSYEVASTFKALSDARRR